MSTHKPDWQYELEDYFKASPELVDFVSRTLSTAIAQDRKEIYNSALMIEDLKEENRLVYIGIKPHHLPAKFVVIPYPTSIEKKDS